MSKAEFPTPIPNSDVKFNGSLWWINTAVERLKRKRNRTNAECKVPAEKKKVCHLRRQKGKNSEQKKTQRRRLSRCKAVIRDGRQGSSKLSRFHALRTNAVQPVVPHPPSKAPNGASNLIRVPKPLHVQVPSTWWMQFV